MSSDQGADSTSRDDAQVVRTYKAKSEAQARAMLDADQPLPGFVMAESTWTPGRRRKRDWIAAFFLMWFVIGIIMIIVWLIMGRPDGTLTVRYEPAAPQPETATVPATETPAVTDDGVVR